MTLRNHIRTETAWAGHPPFPSIRPVRHSGQALLLDQSPHLPLGLVDVGYVRVRARQTISKPGSLMSVFNQHIRVALCDFVPELLRRSATFWMGGVGALPSAIGSPISLFKHHQERHRRVKELGFTERSPV
jgi:hypothetical protein